MTILTEDIKLLKSAVMADVPEGGGAMTGLAVVDGQSNNLFPDTSAMDRAFGRTGVRKLFGVAHSDDTDTLLGAHAMVTDAPNDPLVHCTLLKTAGWADTRAAAQDAIEKYLVKGPRCSFRLYDTHYAGSMQVRLISTVNGAVPVSGGSALVLRNPDGTEQYVRILKVSAVVEPVALIEGGSTLVVNAVVATCDLGNALAFDVLGPPAFRAGVDEDAFAQVFMTNLAGGALFYGIKPLAVAGSPGDYSVMAAGGIYAPIVPAATVESALVDLYPLIQRPSLSRTALQSVTLPGVGVDLSTGTLLRTPTPIEPGSLTLDHAGTLFTDDGAGSIRQAGVTVGSIDYAAMVITLAQGSYGYGTCAITYRPATTAGAATHSTGVKVTLANQGRVFTHAFEPPPAPGTLTISYMAQGRWYDLADNANGKIAGGDTSYGVGNINYATGSMGITLGAIPDVGSTLIYQWGVAASAAPYAGAVPARLSSIFDIPAQASLATLVLTWLASGVAQTAACDANGVLTGDATGKVAAKYKSGAYVNEVTFEPASFPDGLVTAAWSLAAAVSVTATSNGGGSYTLAQTPVAPGSVALGVQLFPKSGFDIPSSLYVVDNGEGTLIAPNAGNAVIGTVNYASGAVQIAATVTLDIYERLVKNYTAASGQYYYEWRELRTAQSVDVVFASVTSISHRKAGVGSTASATASPAAWQFTLPVAAGTTLRTNALLFTAGDDLYTASGGPVSRGWNAVTGAASTPAAGLVIDTGIITLTARPAGTANVLTLVNASVDKASGLSVGQGIFRVASAPLKVGVFQIQAGELVGAANDAGVVSGGGWTGNVDYQRGIVEWQRTLSYLSGATYGSWVSGSPVSAEALSYNAVFLQYLPLDKALLGLDTVRLPLDGRVPIYRAGDLVVVHNTLTTQLPNPLVKGAVYDLGRERIASVRVKDALGVVVPSSLYVSDLNPGTLTVPPASNITPYTQPFTVENRIEDLLLCAEADISGQIKVTRALTHAFPAETSFVSSALPFGDMFARAYGYTEQDTWTGEWSDELIGGAPLANFNEGQFPITTTNRGAITERWAMLFSSSTGYSVVGESVGIIGTGSTGADCAPINPATGAPYFTLPEGGWGAGWSAGNVLRFNTAACGSPFWVVRTVLQGPASLDSDVFSLAFRADVDRA